MKTWQKRIKWIAVTAMCLTAFAFIGAALFDSYYEPKQCVLCGDDMKYHAPVILDLSTGNVAELQVYEPHPYLVGEIAEAQTTGYMSLSMMDGIMMYTDPSESCHATLPANHKKMKKSLYCRECRKLLLDVAANGFVLLDMYDPDNIKVYKIVDCAEYTIRDYMVMVYTDETTRCLNILTTV